MDEGRGRFVALFAVSILAVATAYASAFLPGGAPAWAPWPMALGISGCLVAAMALGASRDGRVGRLAYPFTIVFVLLAGGFATVLALPESAPGELWLGLPPRAAVVLYGIGLLPFLVVPLAYALTFDRMTLDEEDWERIRAAGERRRDDVRGDRAPESAGTTSAGRGSS
ncbi:MAG: hypothetical protein ACOC83_02640 [Gemmatimonadota bacterium]